MRQPCQVSWFAWLCSMDRESLGVHGCMLLALSSVQNLCKTGRILEGCVLCSVPCATMFSHDAHAHLLLAAYGELCAPEPLPAPQRGEGSWSASASCFQAASGRHCL